MSGATTIPTITGAQFAARIADLFPRGWCSDTARQPGGIVYAMLLAVGNEIQITQAELQYALAAQRIGTSTFPELDDVSLDFFGTRFPRPAGLSDAAYAQQIIAMLFQPAATRSALQNALTALTGYVPRMLEPWNVLDSGHWGGNPTQAASFWRVDTVANPARWGNGSLRYQGFIETQPISIAAIGPNNPVLCWGDSAYWNAPGYFFGILPQLGVASIDNTINRLRAFGTVTWVKILSGGGVPATVAPGVVTSLAATSAGTNSISLTWGTPATGSSPFTFLVLYRQSGTTSFSTGPTVTVNSATVPNLAAGISYDFEVQARNSAGTSTSGVVTQSTSLIPPSPATNLVATVVQATAITITWSPPATGTPPYVYTVLYRVTGTIPFQSLAVGAGTIGLTLINLTPVTSYDIEVQATN